MANGVEALVDWPLIGRAEELELLEGLADIRDGAVLAGQPGVGKSRLAHEFRAWAEGQGWALSWLMATEQLREVPFGAFAHLLSSDGSAGTHPFVAAERALRARREAASTDRLLLVVDDGHLLDGSSQALLQHLATVSGVFVLVTVRAGETGASWLIPLWKDGILQRIDLQPLSRAETQQVAEGALGGPLDRGLMETVWRVTRGNPLYLREVLSGALAQGALVDRFGVWHARNGLPMTGPRLVDAVAARLGTLSNREQFVVDLLAVSGGLGLATLELAADTEAIGRLEERRLIDIDPATLYASLAHPLYGEARRAAMPTIQRRNVLRALTKAAPDADLDPSLLVPLALAKLELGYEEPDLFFKAACKLRDLTELQIRSSTLVGRSTETKEASAPAPPLTLQHTQRLVFKLADAGLRTGAGLDAGVLALITADELGDLPAAEATVAYMKSIARDDHDRSLVASHHAMAVLLLRKDRDTAERILGEALSSIDDPAAVRTLTLNHLRLVAMETLGPEVTRRAGELLADPDLEPPHRGEALAINAAALGLQGRHDESLAAADAAIDILGSLPPGAAPMGVTEVVANKLYTHLYGGRLDEHARLLDELADLTREEAAPYRHGELEIHRGEAALLRGDFCGAEVAFSRAVGALLHMDPYGFVGWAYASLAYTRLHRGNLSGADEALAAMSDTPALYEWLQPIVLRASAWQTATGGNAQRARQALLQAAGTELTAGRLPSAALLLHDVSRISYFHDAASRLRAVAEAGYDGAWLPAMIDFADAAATDDGVALDQVSTAFAGLGCALWSAEAATLAAAAHRRAGLLTRERAASVRASALTTQLGRPTSPILRQATEPPVLTSRERDIARLAASGMTDQAIAEHLVLSIRTVQTHLYNAYAKLGVTSRRDLPALLVDIDAGRRPPGR